jgi:hypothetical protein
LLRPDERSRFYAKHNFSSLMRADTLQRYQAYGQAIRDGWLSRNEVRELEELSDEPGLAAYLVPLNTGSVSDDGTINPPNNPNHPQAKVQAVITAAAGRIVRRETKSRKFEPEFVAETLALPLETAKAYCTKREAGAITEGDAVSSLVKMVLEAA